MLSKTLDWTDSRDLVSSSKTRGVLVSRWGIIPNGKQAWVTRHITTLEWWNQSWLTRVIMTWWTVLSWLYCLSIINQVNSITHGCKRQQPRPDNRCLSRKPDHPTGWSHSARSAHLWRFPHDWTPPVALGSGHKRPACQWDMALKGAKQVRIQ